MILPVIVGHARKLLAQDVEKSLGIERYPNEPFSLVELKVSDKSIKSKIALKQRRGDEGLDNVKFNDREDWFRRVRITLVNTSGRPIIGLQAYLYFKVPGSPTLFRVGLEASTGLKRGIINPGDEVDLTVSDRRWKFTADILQQYGADANLASVTLSIERVSFSKDLQWSKGHLLRRDPNNPNKWNVIDPTDHSLNRETLFVRNGVAHDRKGRNVKKIKFPQKGLQERPLKLYFC